MTLPLVHLLRREVKIRYSCSVVYYLYFVDRDL